MYVTDARIIDEGTMGKIKNSEQLMSCCSYTTKEDQLPFGQNEAE